MMIKYEKDNFSFFLKGFGVIYLDGRLGNVDI